jgi:nicotinate-nucleotide pyrophosphorylase (carboxylating)
MLTPLPQSTIDPIVRLALAEDAPWGDITSQTLVPPDAQAIAHLVAREPGVLSGSQLFSAAMYLTDPTLTVTLPVADATPFETRAILATVQGSARSILQAERIALNFTQRLSGIATLTARFVAQTAGTKARIVDTRKTTPGLRALERYAVRCGGGNNHRFSLSDAILAKDNHLAVLARSGPEALTQALLDARAHIPHTTHIEVEVDRLDQIDPLLAAHVDTILLDNFSLEDMRAGVAHIAGRALVEASGNVTLDRVAAIAATGVDLISSGALTHSVRSLDLGLDFQTT